MRRLAVLLVLKPLVTLRQRNHNDSYIPAWDENPMRRLAVLLVLKPLVNLRQRNHNDNYIPAWSENPMRRLAVLLVLKLLVSLRQRDHSDNYIPVWGENSMRRLAVLLVLKPLVSLPLIARFMGPTWGPPGADRIQVGPMLAPWILLSGSTKESQRQLHRFCSIMRKSHEIDFNITGTHFTKGLWAQNWNIVKMFLVVFNILIIQSGHKFAHVTTARLSWHVANCELMR